MKQPREYTFEDLTIWRTHLPDVKFAGPIHHIDRPNPRLGDGVLFVATFSPGGVFAVNAKSGEICWHRQLPSLGHSVVEYKNNLLLAKTSGSLYSLDPATGKTIWEFCPYGPEREMIYSQPKVDGERLFLGDRQGWLHCLNVHDGQTIWKQQLSEGRRTDVNATACVVDGLVITATNGKFAQAFSVDDGSSAWKTEIDGPCIHRLFLFNKQLVVPANSLHFLDPATGKVNKRVEWPGYHVAFAAATPSHVLVLRRLEWTEGMSKEEEERYKSESNKLSMLDSSWATQDIQCSEYAFGARFSPVSGLVYVSGVMGIDILKPDTGEWLYALRTADTTSGSGLPDVSNEEIFAIDGDGILYALRNPATQK
jgi:outer membrane protein assembly factor BamB